MELSYAWEIESTKDKHVLISAGVHYYEKNGRYSQITKIDTSGEIIWTYEGTEAFDNGAVPVWIAELSDGNIVMSYYITGLQAPDTRLQWIDKDGKYLKRQLIDVPDKDEMYHYQLEAGQGAYFYAYGTYTYGDDNTSHGLITKYDNDGNIIWEHLYQHELFAQGGDRTSIKDIIEEENGDIVVLGDLSHPGDKNEIRLFKLNEHGCFGTEDCDEELVLSGIDEMHIDPSPQIYPNPVDGILNIYSEDSRIVGSKLRIANLSGQELGQYDIPSYNSQIDISNIPKSIYIYTITDKSGEVLKIGKFVKE